MARVKIVGEDLSRGLKMDMESLGDAVLNTMTDSIFSMKDITNVMFEFAAAGKFTSEEIAEATEAIKNLAQATGFVGDLGRVAENTAAIMNIYGDQVQGVAEVTDVMAKVANDSVMSIQDIGIAMQYVGPIGVMAGQTFEEIAAALTVLSNQGLQASQAGRYLRQVFTYFAGRTPQSAKAMRQLGLEVIDAEGNFRDLGDIVADLTVGLEGLTEQEQVNLLTRAFGVWGSQAMSALVNAERAATEASDRHAVSLSQVKEGINEEGFAAERAEELLATYEGRKKQLINTTKELIIQLGEKMLPHLGAIMDQFIAITEMEAFKTFIEDLGTVFEALAWSIEKAVGMLKTWVVMMAIARWGAGKGVDAIRDRIEEEERIGPGSAFARIYEESRNAPPSAPEPPPLRPVMPVPVMPQVINQNTISVYGASSGITNVADEILMALTYSLGGRG
jgi:TP901 family phage tail tape measure protein